MKKIISVFIVSLFLFSCSPAYYLASGGVDFTNLTKDGFFITESNSVSFSYKPIGSIYSECSSGNLQKRYKKEQPDEYSRKTGFSDTFWRTANYPDALYQLKKEAVKRGADGIINLTYSKKFDKNGAAVSLSMFGMAIKINK